MFPQLSQNFESGLLSKLQLEHLNPGFGTVEPSCVDALVVVSRESPSKTTSPTFFILCQLMLTSLPLLSETTSDDTKKTATENPTEKKLPLNLTICIS